MSRRFFPLLAFILLAAAAPFALRFLQSRDWKHAARGTVPVRREDYVGSPACAGCHRNEAEAWAGSHHQLAMQQALPGAIRGDFHDATFSHQGVTTRFSTRGGGYFVTTEGADGKPAEFKVKYVIGVRPVQQYVFEFPSGKLQCLTVAWDTEKARWYPLYSDQKIALDDPLHWTGRYQNWNLMCGECHTTDFRKGYDAAADSYRSTWAEFDVGCETCHGPGKAHVEWARRQKPGAPHGTPRDIGIAASPPGGGPGAEVDACAPCHSRRHRIGAERGAGDPLLDEFMPEVMRDPLYYVDGQIHDEVYEYGSFRQSKMYQRGVRCTDCHDPHSATLRAEGNALCTRCHQLHPNPQFPTLAAKEYDAPTHHHHRPGSPGAQCVSCHMPSRNYMIVDARRDHFIRPPRPDESQALGTPNACNGCHRDRSPAWAAHAVDQWFGARSRDSLFPDAVASGRTGARDGGPMLAQVAEDPNRSAMARATALDLLRDYPGSSPSVVANAAGDPDPIVRGAAADAMESAPFPQRVALSAPFLEDSVRAVRVSAARVLAAVPRALLSVPQQRKLEAALGEYERGLAAMADMPATHLNLAVLEESKGRDDLAEESYRTALRMDPYFLPARSNLVDLYNRTHRNPEAERVLREGIARQPQEGELHYSLGLLLAEEQRFAEAAQSLGRAADLLPARARVRYNLALVLAKLGRAREADRVLLEAERIDPRDPEILYAMAYQYAARGDWKRALPAARRLAEIQPEDQASRNLLQRIQRQLGEGGK